jgi:hypothetical protein
MIGTGAVLAGLGIVCLLTSGNSVSLNGRDVAVVEPGRLPLGHGLALGPRGLEF